MPVDELLFCEKIKDIEDFASDCVDIARESEERAVEVREEILLRSHMARRDVGEDVHPQGGLGAELGFDRLRFAAEIAFPEFTAVILVLCAEHGFPIGGVAGW